MDGLMKFEYGGLSYEEQDDRLKDIKDTKEFILALLEKNPNMKYDFGTHRYSAHEDDIGYIEDKLIERFASEEEKRVYFKNYN